MNKILKTGLLGLAAVTLGNTSYAALGNNNKGNEQKVEYKTLYNIIKNEYNGDAVVVLGGEEHTVVFLYTSTTPDKIIPFHNVPVLGIDIFKYKEGETTNQFFVDAGVNGLNENQRRYDDLVKTRGYKEITPFYLTGYIIREELKSEYNSIVLEVLKNKADIKKELN